MSTACILGLLCLHTPGTSSLSIFVLPASTSGAQSELSDPDTQSFEPMFQPPEASSQYSYFTESAVPTGRSDDFGAPGKYKGLIEVFFVVFF